MKADNYNISTEEGTLTVFPSTAASLAAEGYTGNYIRLTRPFDAERVGMLEEVTIQ